MAQYIDKATVVAEIRGRFDEYSSSILKHYDACKEAKAQELGKILTILNTLEVKEVEETPASNDLEEFAKKESELFGEREYEVDYIDRNALAKGYYWGVKAGVQWQKEQDQSTIELAEDHAYFAGSENTREKLINKVCEWLLNNVGYYSTNALGAEYMCKDLRKAMSNETE